MNNVFNFVILLCLVCFGCAPTQNSNESKKLRTDKTLEQSIYNGESIPSRTSKNFDSEDYLRISLDSKAIKLQVSNPSDSLNETLKINKESQISLQDIKHKELETLKYSEQESAVASKIVENYLNSKNKEPGGHCLMVSKTRFEKAYMDVYRHSVYEDLPDSIATSYYTPEEVFDFLYVSASGIHEGWRSLPIEYRGKGNAGAIAYAGMGTLVNSLEIWSGKLKPGAMMQVWKHKSDYEKVVNGINKKGFDPFGHSFIFIRYVRNDKNEIIGIRIADQGYQSYRPLIPGDYEVWWAVNLRV